MDCYFLTVGCFFHSESESFAEENGWAPEANASAIRWSKKYLWRATREARKEGCILYATYQRAAIIASPRVE